MALVLNKSVKDGFDYTIISERGLENPFSVKLKTLTLLELGKFEDDYVARHIDTNQVVFRQNQFNYKICKAGIKNWSNMLDEEGKQVKPKFSNGVITDESMEMLPRNVLEELSTVIAAVTKDPSSLQVFLEPDELEDN